MSPSGKKTLNTILTSDVSHFILFSSFPPSGCTSCSATLLFPLPTRPLFTSRPPRRLPTQMEALSEQATVEGDVIHVFPPRAIKRAPAGTALCNENTQGWTRRWAFGSGSRRRDAGSKREQNAEFNGSCRVIYDRRALQIAISVPKVTICC